MLHVGIVGSPDAIGRHAYAIGLLSGIHVSGRWITADDGETATHADTGITHLSPIPIVQSADALVVAGRGVFCERLAVAALRAARPLFMYPSVIPSVNEAVVLQKLAREASVILCVGKTGGIDISALSETLSDAGEISLIEMHHNYQIQPKGAGQFIRDAILADLEIITGLVNARVISIKAKGLCMLSSQPDIVNARLEFDNGCAANYACNLVAPLPEHEMTLTLKSRIQKYNLITQEVTRWSVQPEGDRPSHQLETVLMPGTDVLIREMNDFTRMIHSGYSFLSSAESGFEPYLLTDRILEKVMKTLVRCS